MCANTIGFCALSYNTRNRVRKKTTFHGRAFSSSENRFAYSKIRPSDKNISKPSLVYIMHISKESTRVHFPAFPYTSYLPISSRLFIAYIKFSLETEYSYEILTFQVSGKGLFELHLKSFTNELGRGRSGNCCSGGLRTSSSSSSSISSSSASDSAPCLAPCRTRFRVCLKHYQTNVDTTSPCTFGDVTTPVLGGNSLDMTDSPVEGFINPIRFPFDFNWPVNIRKSVWNVYQWYIMCDTWWGVLRGMWLPLTKDMVYFFNYFYLFGNVFAFSRRLNMRESNVY